MVNKSLNLITLAKQNISCRIPMMWIISLISKQDSWFHSVTFTIRGANFFFFLILPSSSINDTKSTLWRVGFLISMVGSQNYKQTNHRNPFEQYFWMMSSFTQSCSRTMIYLDLLFSYFQFFQRVFYFFVFFCSLNFEWFKGKND